MISFVIHGNIPSKANTYKMAQGFFYKDKKVVQYEKDFAKQVTSMAKNKFGIKDCLSVELICYLKNKNHDLDNASKIILDCLQKNEVIPNDRQVYKLTMIKIISKTERVNISISQLLM
jgi:Holliday junction resolvase RusA-like endonuclease